MPAPFSRSRPNPPAASDKVQLNTDFLSARGIAVLDDSPDALTVVMADPSDGDALAALRFAAGKPVFVQASDPVPDAPTNAPDAGSTSSAPLELQPFALAPPAPAPARSSSLTQTIGRWLDGAPLDALGFAPLAALIESGLSPQQAASEIITASHGSALPEPAARLLDRLVAGESLDRALPAAGPSAAWLATALSACPDESDRQNAFVALVRQEEQAAEHTVRAGAALAVYLALAVPFVAALGAVSLPIAILALALTGWLGARLWALNTSTPRSPAVRAAVLGTVAILATNRAAPRSAIRSGFARLARTVPTWGSLPETRDELANALALDPLERTGLLAGELDAAAASAARRSAWQARRELERHRLVARVANAALAGVTVILIAWQW